MNYDDGRSRFRNYRGRSMMNGGNFNNSYNQDNFNNTSTANGNFYERKKKHAQ